MPFFLQHLFPQTRHILTGATMKGNLARFQMEFKQLANGMLYLVFQTEKCLFHSRGSGK